MRPHTLFLFLLLILLFAQCKRQVEPSGYYCVINEYIKPSHIFYYNDKIHYSHNFIVYETEKARADSIMSVFLEKDMLSAFFDGNTSIDTLRFTNIYQFTRVLQYHFVFTPSECKFYVYKPDQLVGTYEFVPTRTEQELISFAVSQLDFGDTLPEFNSFEKLPNNVIIEDAYFSLLIKSDRINVDLVAHLYADQVPDAVYFLSDALDALVYDYCNPKHQTMEPIDKDVMESFDEKIYEKYIPPPPSIDDLATVK